MTIAAFIVPTVISLLALGVSILSARYTRQQAREARNLTKIEQARHHKEQEPRFTGRIETVSSWYRLWLRIDESAQPLASLHVLIAEGEGIQFPHGQNGVEPSAPVPTLSATWEAIEQGASAAWRVTLDENRSSEAVLLVTCKGQSDEQWKVQVIVEIPQAPVEPVMVTAW